MQIKILKGTKYILIGFFVLFFFYSLFSLFNVAALYKDQIEMGLFSLSTKENINHQDYENLFDSAIELNNWINFFQFSIVATPFIILWLFSINRKVVSK